MVEMSHHSARTLLQAALDHPLTEVDRLALAAHLSECWECSQYANQLSLLETNLPKVLHDRWDDYRPEPSLEAIQDRSANRWFWNGLFRQAGAFGKITVVVTLLLVYFVIANVIGIRVPISDDETPTALPTPNEYAFSYSTSPTPSTQSTLLDLTSPGCKTILYVVRENDTLEGIAIRYGVPKVDIIEYNPDIPNLATNTVFTNLTLVIPLCESTPIRTASIPVNPYTITPIDGTTLPNHPE